MRPRAVLVAAVLTSLGLFTAVAAHAQDQVANPPFKNWAAFKPGTTVTLKQVVIDKSMDDPNEIDATGQPAGASEVLTTYKLAQATADKVVVEMTQTEIEPGSEVEHAAVKITYPAKVAKKVADMTLPKAKVGGFKEGEEEVDVAGKKVKCKWVESEIKVGDETSTSKLWWSDEVPGGTVKQTVTKKQGNNVIFESTTTVVDVKAVK